MSSARLFLGNCLYKDGYAFKRLFTIFDYYDPERSTFYRSILSVGENGMEMTGWLDYFVTNLETQMVEAKEDSLISELVSEISSTFRKKDVNLKLTALKKYLIFLSAYIFWKYMQKTAFVSPSFIEISISGKIVSELTVMWLWFCFRGNLSERDKLWLFTKGING